MTEPCLRVQFSPREREIAELVADGLSYKEIAAAVAPRITATTVRSHVVRMAKKIDMEGDRAMEPRLQVFAFVRWERWHRRRINFVLHEQTTLTSESVSDTVKS